MDKEKMKFWITCPKCKRTFGVGVGVVFKYLERILGQHPKPYLEAVEEIAESIEREEKKGEPL